MKIFRTIAGFAFVLEGLALLATAPSATTKTLTPTQFASFSRRTMHDPQASLTVSFRMSIPLNSSIATVALDRQPRLPNPKTQIQIQLHANVPGGHTGS